MTFFFKKFFFMLLLSLSLPPSRCSFHKNPWNLHLTNNEPLSFPIIRIQDQGQDQKQDQDQDQDQEQEQKSRGRLPLCPFNKLLMPCHVKMASFSLCENLDSMTNITLLTEQNKKSNNPRN